MAAQRCHVIPPRGRVMPRTSLSTPPAQAGGPFQRGMMMITLATLLRRAEKAGAKAETACNADRAARAALKAEARRIVWAAMEKRGLKRGDRIGFTDPKRAGWYDRAPQLDAVEAYRTRDYDGGSVWRIRLRLIAIDARGRRLKTPSSQYFDLTHPRDVAREVVKVSE